MRAYIKMEKAIKNFGDIEIEKRSLTNVKALFQ